MRYLPQALLLLALGVLLVKSMLPAHERSSVALTLGVEAGRVDFRAEFGAALIALRL